MFWSILCLEPWYKKPYFPKHLQANGRSNYDVLGNLTKSAFYNLLGHSQHELEELEPEGRKINWKSNAPVQDESYESLN